MVPARHLRENWELGDAVLGQGGSPVRGEGGAPTEREVREATHLIEAMQAHGLATCALVVALHGGDATGHLAMLPGHVEGELSVEVGPPLAPPPAHPRRVGRTGWSSLQTSRLSPVRPPPLGLTPSPL